MPSFKPMISLLAAAATVFVIAPATGEAQTAADGQLTAQGLSTGEPVDTTRQPGDTYFKEEFGDWALRCVVRAEGPDSCQMYQLLSNAEDVPIAEFTIFRLPEGSEAVAAATVIVPLETLLQNQLSITVDGESGKRYPFAFCNQNGCYARLGLVDEDIAAFKRGSEATLTIVPAAAPDQRVNVTLSLDGFTAAFDSPDILN